MLFILYHFKSDANEEYAYMWWLNKSDNGKRMANLSASGFYAAGFGGNYIIVEPEEA